MQDFVAKSSKKRTVDMITKDQSQTNNPYEMKELSPVEHIAKYFKRLKQGRVDQENDEESSQSTINQAIKRPPPVLRQESWTIKRSENQLNN